MRLIDAEVLLAEYDRVHVGEPGRARKLIEDAPTIDAEPVVRCKDCRLWSPVGKHAGKCPFMIGKVQFAGDDHYCSLGEREEER